MTEVVHLVGTIKRLLKARGLTYRDVARALDLSEPSVKRVFASERFTVARLVQVAELLGYTLAELTQAAAASAPALHGLSATQEGQLVSDEKLLLVAVCAFNHWTLAEIVAAYRLTEAEGLKRLLVLDRMGVIDLLPGNRIRLRVARDFDWLPDGPIRRYFAKQGQADFLGAAFDGPGEALEFSHAMLTGPAAAELQRELRRLRQKLAALHDESADAPLDQRRGTGLMVAVREWEPAGFSRLRRRPTAAR